MLLRGGKCAITQVNKSSQKKETEAKEMSIRRNEGKGIKQRMKEQKDEVSKKERKKRKRK